MAMLHISLLLIACSAFFLLQLSTTCQRCDTAHCGRSPPTSILNQETYLTVLPADQSDGSTFSIEIPFPDGSGLCHVDKD